MVHKITGTAKVKESTSWIYAGHTFKIISRRDMHDYSLSHNRGCEYRLCLKGTEFE